MKISGWMKRNFPVFVLVVMAGIIYSCRKDKDDDPGEVNMILETQGNNSAILEGAVIGDSSESKESLRKTIDIEIVNDTGNFDISRAYICRSTSTISQINWIIPAKNISGNNLVYIKANDIQFKTSQFILIGSDEEEFIYGELGEDNYIYTTTFLSAGEKGYFVGKKEIPFDELSNIEINSIESGTNNFYRSSIKVVPMSYELVNNRITVKVKNKSMVTVYAIKSPYILLDNQNLPLFWDYLEPVIDSIEVPVIEIYPGEMVNFQAVNYYKGNCNRILPIIEYGLNPY
ncbi:MAG: hypothetical protein JSV22_02450 [Bacteroidales bacterium]|nr:MAG: hypothetical protein JSV22_02450 [Bacteroidales bacterium]